MTDATSRREIFRVCTLCEATCGIEVQVEDGKVASIRGDKEDPFSRGYICPKAYGLKGIEEDRDRLREPVKRTRGGWERISWDEAYRSAIEGLSKVRGEHGPDSVGSYVGN